MPLRYQIDESTLEVIGTPRYLDPEAAAEGIAIVEAQGGAPAQSEAVACRSSR